MKNLKNLWCPNRKVMNKCIFLRLKVISAFLGLTHIHFPSIPSRWSIYCRVFLGSLATTSQMVSIADQSSSCLLSLPGIPRDNHSFSSYWVQAQGLVSGKSEIAMVQQLRHSNNMAMHVVKSWNMKNFNSSSRWCVCYSMALHRNSQGCHFAAITGASVTSDSPQPDLDNLSGDFSTRFGGWNYLKWMDPLMRC